MARRSGANRANRGREGVMVDDGGGFVDSGTCTMGGLTWWWWWVLWVNGDRELNNRVLGTRTDRACIEDGCVGDLYVDIKRKGIYKVRKGHIGHICILSLLEL